MRRFFFFAGPVEEEAAAAAASSSESFKKSESVSFISAYDFRLWVVDRSEDLRRGDTTFLIDEDEEDGVVMFIFLFNVRLLLKV